MNIERNNSNESMILQNESPVAWLATTSINTTSFKFGWFRAGVRCGVAAHTKIFKKWKFSTKARS
jgi:hypothetical protein